MINCLFVVSFKNLFQLFYYITFCVLFFFFVEETKYNYRVCQCHFYYYLREKKITLYLLKTIHISFKIHLF